MHWKVSKSLEDAVRNLHKPCRAVALGASGRVYFGANMEFPGASLASSVHAEQSLTANLLRHKEAAVVTVAISAPPCGHCRQFFSEMSCVVSSSANALEILLKQAQELYVVGIPRCPKYNRAGNSI